MSPAYPEGRSRAGQGSVCRVCGCGLWFRQALVPPAPGMGSKVQPGQCHEIAMKVIQESLRVGGSPSLISNIVFFRQCQGLNQSITHVLLLRTSLATKNLCCS